MYISGTPGFFNNAEQFIRAVDWIGVINFNLDNGGKWSIIEIIFFIASGHFLQNDQQLHYIWYVIQHHPILLQ